MYVAASFFDPISIYLFYIIFYLYNFLFSKTKKQVRKTKSFLFFWCFTFPLFNALTTISRKTSSI